MGDIFPTVYSALALGRYEYKDLMTRLAPKLEQFVREQGADGIAVTGSSGTSLIGGLRLMTDLNIVVVRKPEERSHSSEVNSFGMIDTALTRVIFVDDFVCTGDTLIRVTNQLKQRGVEVVGLMLYNQSAPPTNTSLPTRTLRMKD